MYGKIFSSMYEGSMVGAGPVVFAVWGYCIAKADVDGTVLLNPALLAPIIGTSRGEIDQAMHYLMEPDQHSKNPDHEGRRLLHQTGHLFYVVSHQQYREMKNNEERREYMREYMRKKRNLEDVNSLQVNAKLTKVNPASASASASGSASESGYPEGGCKGGTPAGYTSDFLQFWESYPRKTAKAQAHQAWRKAKDRPVVTDLIAAIQKHRQTRQWQEGIIPHAATWLNQRRWEDEPDTMSTITRARPENKI